MKSLGVIKDRPMAGTPSGKTELTDEEYRELGEMFPLP